MEFATQIYGVGGNGVNFDCSGAFCYGMKTCDHYYNEMPTLEFSFRGVSKSVTLEPWSYTFSEVVIDGETVTPPCTVAVSWLSDDFGLTILGDSFLRQYIASFNYQDNTITLGKSVDAPTRPDKVPVSSIFGKTILIIGIILTVLAAIITIMIFYCRGRGKS